MVAKVIRQEIVHHPSSNVMLLLLEVDVVANVDVVAGVVAEVVQHVASLLLRSPPMTVSLSKT